MSKFIIKNIGPINHIEIQLNRINIFIGPQASGKSTIAKILSFCLWYEKYCVKRQRIDLLKDEKLKTALIDYHNIEGYFRDDSYFYYEGKSLIIEFKHKEMMVKKQDAFYSSSLTKIAYIPSERNIISVPGIFSTKMPNNYILDFIDDWQSIRNKYSNDEAKVWLPELHYYYTYDANEKKDCIVSETTGRPFALSQVSSGMQSIAPLCVMIDYLTDWIYHHSEEQSASDRQTIQDAAVARVMAKNSQRHNVLELASIDQQISEALRSFEDTLHSLLEQTEDISSYPLLKDYKESLDKLSAPANSGIVLEEPELNLFPTTQIQLLYYILSKIDILRDTLVITTHSPYILYALNNCMLGALIRKKSDIEINEIVEDIPSQSFIDAGNVSVWELQDGGIRSGATIQDEKGLIRENYFDGIMQ